MMLSLIDVKIGIIGLGYVGLPLGVEFARKYDVVGFDINEKRITELKKGEDTTKEVRHADIADAVNLKFTSDLKDLMQCNVYIVTVPTPVDKNNAPNLNPLENASKMVSSLLSEGNVVIYESTVFPGATQEICVPLLEKGSSLKINQNFFVGYSPERINPGDKVNTLTKIMKITSGSTEEALSFIDTLYGSIIDAGTYPASSIKVAEAAKVIENTQRDLNIAVINEFAKIFNLAGIDTEEVLKAAGTKWNFLNFKPGLVGGHCISIDPYYLTFKAKELGYQPEVVLAGRHINDGMGTYVATQLVKALSNKKIHIDEARVLILGFTFKGDCPDVRNTKIIDIFTELRSFNVSVDIYDSWASREEVDREYGIQTIEEPTENCYDAIIIAVDHSEFKSWGEKRIRSFGKKNHVVYDVKHVLEKSQSDLRL